MQQQIMITDEVRQDATLDLGEPGSAVAYLVFDSDGGDRVFTEFDEAHSFAVDQLAENYDRETWSIYPLYAGQPVTA